MLTDVAEEFGLTPWSHFPVGHRSAPDIVPNCAPTRAVGARVSGRLAMSVVYHILSTMLEVDLY